MKLDKFKIPKGSNTPLNIGIVRWILPGTVVPGRAAVGSFENKNCGFLGNPWPKGIFVIATEMEC